MRTSGDLERIQRLIKLAPYDEETYNHGVPMHTLIMALTIFIVITPPRGRAAVRRSGRDARHPRPAMRLPALLDESRRVW